MRSIHTCDFFQHMMEVNQGDLADIVRATGFPPPTDPPTASWQFPPDEPPVVPYHPFSGLRDPLLHELIGMPNFDGHDASIGGKSGEDDEKRCDVFSRMQQIVKPPIVAGDTISSPRTPAIKRRKGQAKKVVCIPAPAPASSRPGGEVVPSDLWAWRKYGQKPIKGSPYPRGYYRCSSSKGCSARKQVERSRTDPNMLIITYTSDHNHQWPTQRNALAGSTRSQPSKGNSSSPKISKGSKGEPTKETMTSSNGTSPLVKEEMGAIDSDGFEQFFHHTYKPMLPDSNLPDDFFADLAELDPDPMSLIFSKGYMGEKFDGERESKGLDPTFNMFD